MQWKDARVTREYDVIVKDENGNPIEGALIKIDGKTFISDDAGQAKFSLIFNEFNYIEPKELEVLVGENFITQIDFFTETPIRIGEDSPADFKLILTSEIGGTTDPEPGTYTYDEGTEVTVTATPESGYRFSGWTGNVPSGHEKDNPLTIRMNSDRKITANFFLIHPPLNFTGKKVLNRSLTQAEYINVLSWQANPDNENIVKYRIYQEEGGSQSLLVELNANTFEYWHRKVEKDKRYTYAIVAVNNEGREGEAAIVTIQ